MNTTDPMPLDSTVAPWRAFQGVRGRWAVKALSVAFSLGLVAFLGLRLSATGWSQVLASVPTTPWFYLVFAAFYFCSPLHEVLILKLLWGCPPGRSLPVLVKKRVFSRQLLDYSGEAYLYLWARRHVPRPRRELAHTVKDNVVISSAVSTMVGVVALFALLVSGQLWLPAMLPRHQGLWLTVGGVGSLVLLLGAVRFRRRLLWSPPSVIAALAAVHGHRLVSMMLLELLMWTTVDSTTPLRSWLSLLALELVITRIPFLPSRDLVLLGTGMEMAATLRIAVPRLAGLLLMVSALDKLFSLVFFAVFTVVWVPASDDGKSPPGGRIDGEIPRFSAPD